VTNLLPIQQSPVDFFRKLLVMPPAERIRSLTNRPPESRERIMAKVREYLALDPDERELRLRATELRWYLIPLLRTPQSDRDPNLSLVPADLRDLVHSRLTQWDLLPPALQREFLANDKTLHYFTLASPTVQTNADQQQIADEFNQFLELTPGEKRHVLATLSSAERAQMEKTLETFNQLPLGQRNRCIRNYAKFAGMTAEERAEFLKNADNWSKMSPKDRQAWRDLVEHVPLWPPVPAAILPPPPPHFTPRSARGAMATN